MKYSEYLRSPHWKTRRQIALAAAGGHCMLCRDIKDLEVHHNSYERLWDESEDDLIVLCGVCHERHHLPDRPDEVATLEEERACFWPVVVAADGTARQGPVGNIIGFCTRWREYDIYSL